MAVLLALLPLLLAMVLIGIDLLSIRTDWQTARAMGLPKGQTLLRVKTLAIVPAIEILAVGLLLGFDLIDSWQHLLVGALGVLGGLYLGHFRCRALYVRAESAQKAIVVVRSTLEYRALTILILVRIAIGDGRIPQEGWLALLITFLMALLVSESISRAWFLYHRYVQDTSGPVTPSRTTQP